ncbi:MAG: thermonuclease family protein [Verrucomicrobia bacterium]|nr:thermonuclease family protein [Verrucomicrobiota bacterium]
MSLRRDFWRRAKWPAGLALALSALLLSSCDRKAAPGAPGPPGEWVTLKGRRLEPHKSNDGDSFHVRHKGDEFIFRLYFVDCPETDTSVPTRNAEQRSYFAVTAKELQKAAGEAEAFTAEALKKPFTVTTRSQDAMGRSTRYYAVVTVDGKDLAEMLLARGLGRAKGALANLPDGESAKARMKHFKHLESEAKAKRIGIWADSGRAEKWHERLIQRAKASWRKLKTAVGEFWEKHGF